MPRTLTTPAHRPSPGGAVPSARDAWRLVAGAASGSSAGAAASAARAAERLGLRTLALELAEAAGDSAGASLIDRLRARPDDEIHPPARLAAVERRRAGLLDAGLSSDDIEAWRRDVGAGRVDRAFRAADGNVVLRGSNGAWRRLADLRAAAWAGDLPRDLAQPHPKPVLIDGCDPPWLLLRVHDAAPRRPDGYAPELLVVCPAAAEVLAAASVTPDADVWSDPRLRVFTGPDRLARLRDRLSARLGFALPAALVRTPTDDPAADPSGLVGVVRESHDAQQRAHAELTQAVARRRPAIDAAGWRPAFDDALRGERRLRVLIPTTRYSTFVKHSANDLARAMARLGHEARVLIEPDDAARLVTVGYLRELERFDPDLVVLINYMRVHLGGAMPPGVPVACWIQDRMPHLMRDDVGRAQTPLDFVVGHLHEGLFHTHGFDPARAAFLFVPASTDTFHDGPVDPDLARDLACDIAYVSHQSEPMDAMHDRLRAEVGATPGARRLIDALRAPILDAAGERGAAAWVRRAAYTEHFASERLGSSLDREELLAIQAGYVQPMLERAYRHAALAWAASIAAHDGLRLRLHGKGWRSHPVFARFGAPPLEHAEPLRTLYRCAGANLHASVATNAHQRIAECALAGGLMLRRGPCPDFEILHRETIGAMARAPGGVAIRRGGVRVAVRAPRAEAPDPDRLTDALSGAPLPGPTADHASVTQPSTIGRLRRAARSAPASLMSLPDYAFPAARETLYEDEASLRRIVRRALNDRAWRRSTIDAHTRTARRHMTYDAAAQAIIRCVRDGLAPAQEATT